MELVHVLSFWMRSDSEVVWLYHRKVLVQKSNTNANRQIQIFTQYRNMHVQKKEQLPVQKNELFKRDYHDQFFHTLTLLEDCLGNPLQSTPTSVVVPPISTTMASCTLERWAAPRILFVGPDAKVRTGNSLALSSLNNKFKKWKTNEQNN